MQSLCFLLVCALCFVLAQEEPETKELFGSRRKINLVNNVLHSTVRKILRPYRNKIPRTFTKNTRVYHGNLTFSHITSNSIFFSVLRIQHVLHCMKYVGKESRISHGSTSSDEERTLFSLNQQFNLQPIQPHFPFPVPVLYN